MVAPLFPNPLAFKGNVAQQGSNDGGALHTKT
jgi:hypothetical protein